jgi:hypothetical protein
VCQKKTGQPVKFEMTEQTREAIDSYIRAANKKPGEFLFGGRRPRGLPRHLGIEAGHAARRAQTERLRKVGGLCQRVVRPQASTSRE